jgi:NAD+ kinase
MTSPAGSTTPSPSPDRPVRRAAVVLHGKPDLVAPGLARLRVVARDHDVELVEDQGSDTEVDVAIVLGGDGTMLRALTRYLGTRTPVIGVNFGRVGFLTSIPRDDLEAGLTRAFSGELDVVELPTLEVEVGGRRHVAVNDMVVTSATLGRMVELEWAVRGEQLGRQPCDGVVCSTPSGSTAYNLSNGGPVLMWGLDAMAVTFVAPHTLHTRPFVIPRGSDVVLWNRTPDVSVAVLVDGHDVGAVAGGTVRVRLGPERSLLGTIPGASFVQRYRQSFAS